MPVCQMQRPRSTRTTLRLLSAATGSYIAKNMCHPEREQCLQNTDFCEVRYIIGNNNNNIADNVYGAVTMTQSLREFTRFI